MVEAVIVITLNILFLREGISIVCIELISLSASTTLFATVRFPIMIKIIHGKALQDLLRIYFPSLLVSLPAIVVLLLCKKLLQGRTNDFLLCAVCGTAYAVVYTTIAWQVLIGRTKKELWKRRVMIHVRKYLNK